MPIANTQSIIKDLQAGKLVIIVDDEARENEGDLLIAAEKITPESINFMSKYGRGLICLTLTAEHCQRLKIPLMVSETNDQLTTNFTISIDAKEGVSTGISAQDRAHTVLSAVNPNAGPNDVVQPGHIFPLMAQPGGVLTRAGHTEAGCDLARLAGFASAAVIVEILNDDGTMARRDDINSFATQHQLKVGTIEDLIRYRVQHERTVHFKQATSITTKYGTFMLHIYYDMVNDVSHIALSHGEIQADKPTLVRVHIEDTLSDVIQIQHKSVHYSFDNVLKKMASEACGVIVLLRLPEHNKQLIQQLEKLSDTAEKMEEKYTDHWTIGIGGQILQHLGVGKMTLLHTPKRFHALGGFGLSIEGYA